MRQSLLLGAAAILLWPLLESPAALQAQVLEVFGGASSAYGAQGVGLQLQDKNLAANFGAGTLQGRFAAGGALTRKLGDRMYILGQQELHMDLPTDVFDSAHFLFATGLSMTRRTDKEVVQAFVGWASQEAGTPLFRAANLGKPTQFLQWSRQMGTSCGLVTESVMGSVTAALLGFGCDVTPDTKIAASVGVGAKSPYAAVSVVLKRRRFRLRASYSYAGPQFQRGNNPFQPTPEPVRENISLERELSRTMTLSLTHGNFLTAAGEGEQASTWNSLPIRSTLDSAALQFHHGRYAAGVSVLNSGYSAVAPTTAAASTGPTVSTAPTALTGPLTSHFSSTALTANTRYTRQRWQFGQVFLYSVQNSFSKERPAILSNNFSLNVSSRLRLTEAVNLTNNGVTFSHGGMLLTRYSSFEVDYQYFYVVNHPDQPFQQSLLFNGELKLPMNFALRASSTIDAFGRPLYTYRIGKLMAREYSSSSLVQTSLGENMVQGRVVDEDGRPVEGAALSIGDHRVYTGGDGCFMYRERRSASHPLVVLTSEFISVGNYGVVSAPQSVRSTAGGAQAVRIVVKILRLEASQANAPAAGVGVVP